MLKSTLMMTSIGNIISDIANSSDVKKRTALIPELTDKLEAFITQKAQDEAAKKSDKPKKSLLPKLRSKRQLGEWLVQAPSKPKIQARLEQVLVGRDPSTFSTEEKTAPEEQAVIDRAFNYPMAMFHTWARGEYLPEADIWKNLDDIAKLTLADKNLSKLAGTDVEHAFKQIKPDWHPAFASGYVSQEFEEALNAA